VAEGRFRAVKRSDRRGAHSDPSRHHERLSKTTDCRLSSDALSSVAYATEEILRVLDAAGCLKPREPIGAAIAPAGTRRLLFRQRSTRIRPAAAPTSVEGQPRPHTQLAAAPLASTTTLRSPSASRRASRRSRPPSPSSTSIASSSHSPSSSCSPSATCAASRVGTHLFDPDVLFHQHDPPADRRRRVSFVTGDIQPIAPVNRCLSEWARSAGSCC
jgi:hypothetical protein